VLHDHGISRRHARILTRGGRHFVADLGSTGGTLLNGRPLGRNEERELLSGGRLMIGAVEFVFAPLSPPSEDTRLIPAPAVRPRSRTLITRAQTEQEMQAIEREDTGRHRTVTEVEVGAVALSKEAGKAPPAVKPGIPELPTMPMRAPPGMMTGVPELPTMPMTAPSATLMELEVSTVIQKAEPPSPRHSARAAAASTAPSAAERARLRRQHGGTIVGRAWLWWTQLPPRGRSVAGVAAGLLIITLVGSLVAVLRPGRPESRPEGPEPTELSFTPLADSFGLGEGVTWKQPDQKLLHFEFASPTRAVAVLHYQARDIALPQEVSISLNGVDLGWVPSDSLESEERELQLLLPLQILRRDQPNTLAFDNAFNPPGKDAWRVWNMYVEVIPVPELPVEQLLAKAYKEAAAARRFYEQKDVGSENLFKSWKLFRSAWLTLEALDTKPDLYAEVLFLLAQTARELDQQCRLLMLDFQRSLQYQDGDKARATVEEVMRRFPTTEHRCHNLALEKANQYELPI
jgi:FHA domain